MQATIAAWLMATLTPSAFMVALVQTASTAPTLLFGLVAGALADIADRRSLSRMGTHGPAIPLLCRIRMAFGARMSILQLGVLAKEHALLHTLRRRMRSAARDANWTLESPSAFAIGLPSADGSCAAGLISVYRFSDGNRGDMSNYRYTTDLATRAQMISQGCVAEGLGPNAVEMCSPP